jgi:hypothetical protein
MPLTGNLNGAAALSYSHLRGLIMALPEASFHLVVLKQHTASKFNAKEITTEFSHVTIAVTEISFTEQAGSRGRKKQLFASGISPLLYFYPFLIPGKLRELQSVLDNLKPDVIWTEHLLPNLAVRLVKTSAPVVYGHHDFLWKVIGLRQSDGGWKKKLLNQVRKRAESRLIRANEFFAGGSQTELDEIRRLCPGAATAFLPAAYVPVPASPVPRQWLPPVRLVHLGTMSATANRVGLERFLQVCWPTLQDRHPGLAFKVIGDLRPVTDSPLAERLRQPGIECLGFVEDLTTVLRAGDIFVIPYEFDTGTRTRLPLALNYKQLLVAHKNACRGIAGLESMKNCILVDSLEEMTSVLIQVLRGEIDCVTIAENGHNLFLEEFTVNGQLPRMGRFLKEVLNNINLNQI